ncbi:hypothetical protein [Bacteroides sp.]
MNSLDFFFYSFVTFQVKVLKRDLDDSRWSAALMTSLFLCIFIAGLFMSGSLFYRNNIANMFVNSKSIWMMLGIVVAILIVWRFFHFVKYEALAVKRRQIKYIWIYHVINWLIVIGAPVLLFVTFRLYLYGYV